MPNNSIITLDHGAGGTLMRSLIQDLFVQTFGGGELARLEDGASIATADMQHVFTTDSYVVHPLEFPGGDIGKLAVCGTVNDLLVMGAKPLFMSVAMIIEEGLPFEILARITRSLADTAARVPVTIVTGDTKVVPRGHCDKLFINTSAIGSLSAERRLSSQSIQTGDAVLISGTLGDHAIAIMTARGNLALSAEIKSDCAPLAELVDTMLVHHESIKWMRDATRGGLAAVLDEFCSQNRCTVEVREGAIPVANATRSICDLLGYDPVHLANEGKIVAVVERDHAASVLRAMRQCNDGANAAEIGSVVSTEGGAVRLVTTVGGTRTMRRPTGELLPRIC